VRRLVELTPADLSANPVWRYEGGSGEDARVAPVKRDVLSRADDEIYLAATEFELFDSTSCTGYCFPADGAGVDYLQPVILTPAGPVAFWFERPPAGDALERQWRALGKQPGQIFPVSFRCLVLVDGQTLRGRIERVEFAEEPEASAPAPSVAPPRESRAAAPRRRIGASDTRTAKRRAAEMTVEFSQGTLYGTGVTGDVSRRGMFVRSPWIPGTGPVLRLTVNLPGGRKLALTGRAVRTVDPAAPTRTPPGFGLRLNDEWPGYDELFGKRPKK
jgi:hypothetical protein